MRMSDYQGPALFNALHQLKSHVSIATSFHCAQAFALIGSICGVDPQDAIRSEESRSAPCHSLGLKHVRSVFDAFSGARCKIEDTDSRLYNNTHKATTESGEETLSTSLLSSFKWLRHNATDA